MAKTELPIEFKVQGAWKVKAVHYFVLLINKIRLPFVKSGSKSIVMEFDIKPRF